MGRKARIIRFPGREPEPKGRGPRAAGGPGQDERSFAEVHRCRDESEALVLQGLFESEGIRYLLRTRLAHSVHPFTVGDQGEVIVLVAEADVPRARVLLARLAPGPSFP